jgi:hypothetical protein
MTKTQELELIDLIEDLVDIGYLCDPDNIEIDDLPQVWEILNPLTSQLLEHLLIEKGSD